VGGIVEIVVEGETGLLVEAGAPAKIAEAARRLLTDPGEARAMGLAGRRRVEEHFGWAAIAQRTKALYEGLL